MRKKTNEVILKSAAYMISATLVASSIPVTAFATDTDITIEDVSDESVEDGLSAVIVEDVVLEDNQNLEDEHEDDENQNDENQDQDVSGADSENEPTDTDEKNESNEGSNDVNNNNDVTDEVTDTENQDTVTENEVIGSSDDDASNENIDTKNIITNDSNSESEDENINTENENTNSEESITNTEEIIEPEYEYTYSENNQHIKHCISDETAEDVLEDCNIEEDICISCGNNTFNIEETDSEVVETYTVSYLDIMQNEIKNVEISSINEISAELPEVEKELYGSVFRYWAVVSEDGSDIVKLADFINEGVLNRNIQIAAIYEYDVTVVADEITWDVDSIIYNSADAIQIDDLSLNSDASINGYLFDDGMLILDGNGTMASNLSIYKNNATSATKLYINNNVQNIGDSTFEGCSNLTGNLILPSSIISIGNHAFSECSGFIGDLKIPNNVVSIGNHAFYYSDGFNGQLVLSDNLTSIGDRAFQGCYKLNGNLVLPSSITSIGNGAFVGCSGFAGNLNIPNTLSVINDSTFRGCSGFTGDLVIPDNITSIGNNAFTECSGFNGTLTLSNNLTTINESSFSSCGFTGSLVIPEGVTNIESNAFYNFGNESNYTSVSLPSTLVTIGNEAFYGCDFSGSLIIPNNVTSIGNATFRNCINLTGTLTLSSNLTTIGDEVFLGCPFTGDLIFPETITSIGNGIFYINSDKPVKTKLFSTNQLIINYDWANDNRITSWTDYDSLSAIYNNSGVIEGEQPLTSDFIVKANYITYTPNDYTVGTVSTIIVTPIMTCSDFVYGQDNTVSFSYRDNTLQTTKTTNIVVPCIAKTEINRTITEISAIYNGNDVIEKLQPSTDDFIITAFYDVEYDNGTFGTTTEIINTNDCIFTIREAVVGINNITVEYNGKITTTSYVGIQKSEINRSICTWSIDGTAVEGMYSDLQFITVKQIEYKVEFNNGDIEFHNQNNPSISINSDAINYPVIINVGENRFTTTVIDDYGLTITTDVTVTGIAKSQISKTLTDIHIQYNGDDIVEGLQPNKDDFTITADYHITYNNNTEETINESLSINDCTFTMTDTTVGINTVQISYLYNGVVKTASIDYMGISKSDEATKKTEKSASTFFDTYQAAYNDVFNNIEGFTPIIEIEPFTVISDDSEIVAVEVPTVEPLFDISNVIRTEQTIIDKIIKAECQEVGMICTIKDDTPINENIITNKAEGNVVLQSQNLTIADAKTVKLFDFLGQLSIIITAITGFFFFLWYRKTNEEEENQ